MCNETNHRCPHCGRYVGTDPDGFYDHAERNGDDYTPVAAFCDERCADKFHGRKSKPNYWKPTKQEPAAVSA